MKYKHFNVLVFITTLCCCLTISAFAAQKSSPDFTDVPAGAWYYDALEYATMNGFISGTGNNTFSPSAYMSRAQFVTILGRMVSADISTDSSSVLFEDVESNAYYAPYVSWAVQNGYATGTSETMFSPDDFITREQMAIILSNYITSSTIKLKENPIIGRFSDSADISSDAVSAMETMRKYGILSGDSKGNVEPQKPLSRSEGTAVITKFSKLLGLGKYEPVAVQSVSFSSNNYYEPWMGYWGFYFGNYASDVYEVDYNSTIKLSASVYPENATNSKIYYTSSNSSIASVSSDGVVTGNRGGTAIITAMSANGQKAEVTVTVNGPTIIFDASSVTSGDLVNAAVQLIPDGDEEYKIQMIHDLIVNTLEYDPRVASKTFSYVSVSADETAEIEALYAAAKTKYKDPNNITLYTGYGVCEDYANLFYEMCVRTGIQCRKISGHAGGGGHAWNQVCVDGVWYNVDCTWDDPVSSSRKPILRYDYFMISMEEMADDHYWSGYGYPYALKYDTSWNSIDITNVTNKLDWYKGFIAQLAQKKTNFTMTAAGPNIHLDSCIAYNYKGWSKVSSTVNGYSYTYTVTYR